MIPTSPSGRALKISAIGLFVLLSVLCKAMPYIFMSWGWNLEADDVRSYLWNFSPMLPLAVISGCSLSSRWGVLLPVFTWLAGDLAIWVSSGRLDWAFYPHQPLMLCLVAVLFGMGHLIGTKIPAQTWTDRCCVNVGSGLLGAILFFLISNFGIWAIGNEFLYAQTWQGLIECYVNALPFFRNSLISTVLFAPILTLIFTAREPAQSGQPELAAAVK